MCTAIEKPLRSHFNDSSSRHTSESSVVKKVSGALSQISFTTATALLQTRTTHRTDIVSRVVRTVRLFICWLEDGSVL
jgi:hypothetical protein